MSIRHAPKPLVSIVIPCFNGEKFIGEAIESGLSQLGASIEVIVVDDGSIDNSWNVVSSFGDQITARKTTNRGVSEARNLGVSICRGDWVKFLDADDRLLNDAVSRQVQHLAALPTRSIPVGQLCMDTACTHAGSTTQNLGTELTPFELSARSLQVSQPLFPKVALDEIGGFRQSSISEDYEVVVRAAINGWRFFRFDEPIVFYRDHDEAQRLSKALHGERFHELIEVYSRLLEELRASEDANARELRNGLGNVAWAMARRAARSGYQETAERLFAIAEMAGGRAIRKARFPVSLFYVFFGPVSSERCAELFKRILGKLKNGVFRLIH